MMRSICAVAITAILTGCGPKPGTDVEEPGGGDESATVDDGVDEGTAVEVEGTAEAEADEAAAEGEGGDDGEPQEIVGSASQKEVEPMEVKDYNVDFEIEFSPAPAAEGKQGVLTKVGEAGLPITMCYRKLVLDDAEMQGDMKVSVKINAAGVAKPVKILENTTGSDKLGSCVVKELGKPKYPKKLAAGKAVEVTVVLKFRPYLK